MDSGLGGLAVAREVMSALPGEKIIYVGDTAHFPYGVRSASDVLACVRDILAFFREEGVKLAVLACNTASAVALPTVRAEFLFPIVGVIEAGARMAVQRTRNRCVGVLATQRTVESGAYQEAVRRLAPAARVIGQPAPQLVTMVEEGYAEREPAALDAAIAAHVGPLLDEGADTIILGCTHFLTFAERIARLFPGRAAVIDPAAETARQVAGLLAVQSALRFPNGMPAHRFLVSGWDQDRFRLLGSRILGRDIQQVGRFRSRMHAAD